MAIELVVPKVGESITEVQIVEWLKKEGDRVERDGNLAVIETDKATVELPAPVAGVLSKILKTKGSVAKVGEVIGYIEEGAVGAPPETVAAPATASKTESGTTGSAMNFGPETGKISVIKKEEGTKDAGSAFPKPEVKSKPEAKSSLTPPAPPAPAANAASSTVMPAAARALAESGMNAADVQATGPGNRLLKEDVLKAVDSKANAPIAQAATPAPASVAGSRNEEAVPMSMLRRKVAERLVQAQQTAALLTTFNEVDMTEMMELRKRHQDAFVKKYGIKLGFMSFFVK
ncbi:MAG: biotin/lipoyl-containing protein, partial [Fibrobacteria bacterium]